MFKFLTRLETVRRAETQREREAIYRFRYQVYVEELKYGCALLASDQPAPTFVDSLPPRALKGLAASGHRMTRAAAFAGAAAAAERSGG